MRALALFGLVAGLCVGCDADDGAETKKPTGTRDGAAGFSGGSSITDSGSGDSGIGDASEDSVLPDASDVAVRVGIVPVSGGSDDGGTSHVEETLAHQDIIAAGSRAVTIVRRWDALFSDTNQPIEAEWQYLSGLSKLYAGSDRQLLLSLAVVDRTLDARPASLSGAWDSDATKLAMHALVDRTFSSFGPELFYLSFGAEVDRFLEPADASERAAFVAFAKSAVEYARSHPFAPANLRVGVSISARNALEGISPAPDLAQLMAAGDVAVVAYHALDIGFRALPASSASGDLDALFKSIGGPVVLEEVAYPSATETESSPDQQAQFYDGLFVALQSRRDRFPFVAVRGSNEAPLEVCQSDAVALGKPGDPTVIAAYCSFGLRRPDGANKPAWASVVDGLVTFSTP